MEQETITAGELQEQFATLYGAQEGVIWDLYTSADKDLLVQKLEFLIPNADYSAEVQQLIEKGNLTDRQINKELDKILSKEEKSNKKLAEHRAKLLDVLWSQRKYSNGDLVMSIIFVLVIPNVENCTPQNLQRQTTFSYHPVFRVRKCKVGDNSADCCGVFVDENGRVYQNWRDYLDNNTLPEGVMLAPESGVYKFNDSIGVILTVKQTPESSTKTKALKATDIGATVLGVTAILPAVVGLFTPITAPVVIGAAFAGFGSGLWNVGRCTGQLVDRGNHEESISMANREARAAWFGIAGGVAGMGAAGATQGLNLAVAKGKDITKIAQIAVNGVNITSLTVNGMGIGNSALHLILKKRDDERINALEIMQFSVSLVLFTHSIYNFKLVSNLPVSDEGGSTWQQFRKMLGDAQKKVFKALTGNTGGSTVPAVGNQTDLIREPGIIPDNDSSITIGAAAMRVAECFMKRVIAGGFFTQPQDLKFCLLHILKTLQECVVDVLFEIAEAFLSQYTAQIGRLIPFEHVVWRALDLIKKLYGIDRLTAGQLRKFASRIVEKLKELYCNAPLDNSMRIKCNNCPGYYSIATLN